MLFRSGQAGPARPRWLFEILIVKEGRRGADAGDTGQPGSTARARRSSNEAHPQGGDSGEPPIPRGVPASHGKFMYREAPEASRRCRQPPTEVRVLGPGRRGSGSVPEAPAAETRSSTSGSPGRGDVRVLVRQGEGKREDAAGGDGTGGRGLGPCTASSVEHLPAGVFRPGRCGAPSGTQHVGWCGDGHIASKRLASWSSEYGTGSQRVRRVRPLATAGKPHRKAGAEQKPHEWQRSSRSQRGRGANRRGSEKLRGRNVPGEASPGRADPVTDVAEGAPEPHEGNRRPSNVSGRR